VLKKGVTTPCVQVEKELVAIICKEIGAVACFKHAVVVARLPKTRSGKTLRATIKAIADSHSFKIPATIDDPAVLDEMKTALKAIGYAK
jgi:propionyl-CoA synthetase